MTLHEGSLTALRSPPLLCDVDNGVTTLVTGQVPAAGAGELSQQSLPQLPSRLLCHADDVRPHPRLQVRHHVTMSRCHDDVMMTALLLPRLQDSLSKRDLCVLLTACICHDLDHPGFNNTYQINAKTELAIRLEEELVFMKFQ